ncbi:hypothetical protein SVIO_031700 [Streptomyces violaceusniger]|uniref:Uncharacterized protein n=1 Tax=Streptomyces violaceusniger TaxID=68280 RepID=A0A4D4L1F8_STRVO|nr:hypothetical protein SVIO_031700 [Streptomyces violaceusniger]
MPEPGAGDAVAGPAVEPMTPAAEATADRTVFLLAHTGRPAAIRSAELVVQGLLRSGIGVRVLAAEAADLPLPPLSSASTRTVTCWTAVSCWSSSAGTGPCCAGPSSPGSRACRCSA